MISLMCVTSCGIMTTLTSCTDDDNKNSSKPEEQDVKELLKGSWFCDFDGVADVDFMGASYNFGDGGKANVGFFFFSEERDEYMSMDLGFTYRALSSVQAGGRKLHQIELTPTAETLRELHLDESLQKPDTMLMEISEDWLRLVSDVELAEPINYEGMAYDFANICTRGTFDINSFDKAKTKEYLAKLMQDDDDTENQAAQISRRASRSQTSTGRNLNEWMKDLPDSRQVRDLMLPGSHDCGTFGLRGDYMTTFGKTQMLDYTGQFYSGSRVFDLRTRSVDKTGVFDNYIFHDMMDCNRTLESALNDIKKCLKDNPSEGVIITIKGEGNQLTNFIDGKADWMNKNFWDGHTLAGSILGQFVKGTLNEMFRDGIICNIDYTELNKTGTTNRAAVLVKKIFYDSGMLAKFNREMEMEDLRGKALVVFQDYGDPSEGWGVLGDHVALSKGGKYFTPDGSASTAVYEQNDWDQEKDQTEDQYVAVKNEAFNEMLMGCNDDKRGFNWIINACNGYFLDGGTFFPDYITYASRVYPVMAANVEAARYSRGMCIMDYMGCDYVPHAPILEIFTAWRTYKTIGSVFLSLFTQDREYFVKMFKMNYQAALESAPRCNTFARQLTEAMVERNFSKSEESALDRKIIATSGTNSKGNESYNQLFDGDLNTKWCVNKKDKSWDGVMIKGDKVWGVEFHTIAPVRPVGFTLYTGNDTSIFPKRNPKKWGLVGKLNKDDAWTHIAWYESDGNYALPSDKNRSPVYMPFNGSNIPWKMQYFRFEVYSNLGDDCVQFAELELNY